MPDPELERLVRAADLNYLEFGREMARWGGRAGTVCEEGGVLLTAGGSPFPVSANGVVRLDPAVPAAEVLERANAFFAARQRGYSVSASSWQGVDDDLMALCRERGYLDVADSPEMVVRAPVQMPEPPPGVELRWIDDEAGVDRAAGVNVEAYGSLGLPKDVIPASFLDRAAMLAPHLHTVLALLDGEPVATAQTMLSHGVAGVYWVGTVERARGRGLAELVTAAVTNRGFELGSPINSLQASKMGEPVYRRMGYEELYRYRTLVHFGVPG
jgi:hypothetical protein